MARRRQPPYVRPNAHRDHILSHLFAAAHTSVETLGDDVGQGVSMKSSTFDVWILAQKF